jgi:two-component system sensor histidine kinase ComP
MVKSMRVNDGLGWANEFVAKYMSDPVFILDQNRVPVFISPKFQETFGIEMDELMEMDLFSLIHHGDRAHVEGRFERLFLLQEAYHSEHRITDKEGRTRYWECRTAAITKAGKKYALVASRDVTDRKRMELELQEKKNRYEELQTSLRTFSKELASVREIAALEDQLLKELERIFLDGYPSIQVIDQEDGNMESGEIPVSRLVLGKLETFRNQAFVKTGIHGNKVYLLTLNADAIRGEMDVTYLETLAQYVAMVFENLNVIGNLTKQLEYAVQGDEQPHWMMRLQFNLQEKHRIELSSELHDTVFQDQIDLYRRLEELLDKSFLESDMKNQLKSVEQGLLDSIHQIRLTCNELRPPLLRELGLERALGNLFEHTQVSSTFKISFANTSQNSHLLNEEQTIGVYRVVQELLNNALKHSKAFSLAFILESKEDQFVLKYRDDGIGFEAEKLKPSFASMGLSSIRQRARSLSGDIQFYSSPGHGMQAIMHIPVSTGIKR